MSRDGWAALPRGATGLSAVCDCGISWSYSLTILEANEWISLAAYYSSISEPPATSPTKSYMLLLFTESSSSPAMVWHGMKVLPQAINNINPRQTPVKVADKPLFTLAKKLQWKYPQTEYDKVYFLVTLGACTLRRCCRVCLVTGWMVVVGLQHSLTVVS